MSEEAQPPDSPSPPSSSQVENPEHGNTLTEFLSNEYDSIATSLLADVSIYCKATEFKAHRIVLSHYSNFFRDIFNSVPGSKHFDLFLEGFDEPEIETVLTFCYTGNLVLGGGERGKLADVANALNIRSLSSFLASSEALAENNNKPGMSPPHESSSSPVSIWQKVAGDLILDHEDELEFASDDDSFEYEYECKRKQAAAGGVSKRRKQARPKRHKPTPPHSRSQSPAEEMSCSDDEEEYTPPDSYEDDDLHSRSPPPPHPQNPESRTSSPQIPHPLPTPPQSMPLPLIHDSVNPPPPPPPHFMFLRNMINQSHVPGAPPGPPPPHFFNPHTHHHPQQQGVGKKLGMGPKGGLWGKLMSKQAGGVFHHHHGSSRAQHSAPRGGPPRAWSNQDLTEALHNVWNKKMTTSQASRIFGIPYNSLLMYVRGKYGKSLKLDLLKKGLDLALLEKQQAQQKGKPPSTPAQQQNGNGAPPSSTSSPRELAGQPRNNNVVEWMMMNSGAGKGILDQRPLFHAGMFFPGGPAPGGKELPRKQEIGK